MPDLREVLQTARRRLQDHGCDAPELEADLLLSHALGVTRSKLLAMRRSFPTAPELERFDSLLDRRCRREPLAYIIGWTDFYGRRFVVEPGVLVPRVDTETLVDVSLELLRIGAQPLGGVPDVLELGVGSGCIICSLLAKASDRTGAGADISETALRVTSRNAVSIGVDDRLTLLKSDWFNGLPDEWRGKLPLIVSNPPYIDLVEKPVLQPEVRDFEPETALFANDAGLGALKHILAEAIDWLMPGGWVAVELGYGQATAVKQLAADFGFSQVASRVDTGGVERVVYAQRPA